MLAQPHAPSRIDVLQVPLASVSVIEPVLGDSPALANTLLFQVARYYSDRLDLVELALRHGADPSGAYGRAHSFLGAFSTGISPASVEAVRALLDAGADPNVPAEWDSPAWVAVGTLTQDRKSDETDRRAMTIFHMLRAAGADLNQPDRLGEPGVWRFLTIPGDITPDAHLITPEVLEMLLQNGLDLNAEWRGKRVLTLVEEKAGADSELAATLRRLGAQR